MPARTLEKEFEDAWSKPTHLPHVYICIILCHVEECASGIGQMMWCFSFDIVRVEPKSGGVCMCQLRQHPSYRTQLWEAALGRDSHMIDHLSSACSSYLFIISWIYEKAEFCEKDEAGLDTENQGFLHGLAVKLWCVFFVPHQWMSFGSHDCTQLGEKTLSWDSLLSSPFWERERERKTLRFHFLTDTTRRIFIATWW